MAQLSRPYQIILGVVLVFGLIWAVALRSHASNPSQPVPSSPTAATSASTSSTSAVAEAKAAGAPTPIYHGAAPGVEGLTRAIAKAHGAVATSQQNAQQLQHKSGEASGEAQTSTTPVVAAAKRASSAAAQKPVAAAALAHRATARRHGHIRTPAKTPSGRTAAQIAVESELAHGKTVMLVFWNPKATVDREVQAQAGALAHGSKGTVTIHTALAHQVGIFGKITEVVRVYQTPTILIVNRRGVVSTLTGLTDVFALEQAVREARRATR
ncbi:MAG TPA: hypothetical protein VK781_10430 [Solirubrobacteraceae bacterium]|jgi:hypothetical protein|nr:hypothetical protein [Solirubrobacteraceae bacterium]